MTNSMSDSADSKQYSVPEFKLKNLELKDKIGSGGFSKIYMGTNGSTQNKFAVKVFNEKKQWELILKSEYEILVILTQGENGAPFPVPYYHGQYKSHKVLIEELLSFSVEKIQEQQGQFGVANSLKLGYDLITVLEKMHQYGFIHRDISPKNMAFRKTQEGWQLCLIDMGMSKRFKCALNEAHCGYEMSKDYQMGTYTYSSIYTHIGIAQSRRDDLESTLYSVIRLMRGYLPWDKKNDNAFQIKSQNPDENFPFLPQTLKNALKYVRGLAFEEEPNYGLLRTCLKQAMKEENVSENYAYTWNPSLNIFHQ